MSPSHLTDRMRVAVRTQRLSYHTEKSYLRWAERFLQFQDCASTDELSADEARDFLSYLAVERHVSASTQNQALSALLFLFRNVLDVDIERIEGIERARRPDKLPTVFTREEVRAILKNMDGIHRLVGRLLYGAGLRLREALRLRVKDLQFERRLLLVRRGKGEKDRATMLPATLHGDLREHLAGVRQTHDADLAEGFGSVYLPHALARKYPNAPREWGWQYVFPSPRRSVDPRSGRTRRHHRSASATQKAVRRALRRSGLSKPGSCHTFRHSFATHLIENGYDIRTVQTLLGHASVQTTMIYTHVCGQEAGAQSPLDTL